MTQLNKAPHSMIWLYNLQILVLFIYTQEGYCITDQELNPKKEDKLSFLEALNDVVLKKGLNYVSSECYDNQQFEPQLNRHEDQEFAELEGDISYKNISIIELEGNYRYLSSSLEPIKNSTNTKDSNTKRHHEPTGVTCPNNIPFTNDIAALFPNTTTMRYPICCKKKKTNNSAQWKADYKEQQNPITICLSPSTPEKNTTEGYKNISYKTIFTSELEKATESAQWKADCKEQQNPISNSLSPNISEENKTEGSKDISYKSVSTGELDQYLRTTLESIKNSTDMEALNTKEYHKPTGVTCAKSIPFTNEIAALFSPNVKMLYPTFCNKEKATKSTQWKATTKQNPSSISLSPNTPEENTTEGSKFISYKNIFTSELEKATESAQRKADCKEQQNPITISLSPNISEENKTEGSRDISYKNVSTSELDQYLRTTLESIKNSTDMEALNTKEYHKPVGTQNIPFTNEIAAIFSPSVKILYPTCSKNEKATKSTQWKATTKQNPSSISLSPNTPEENTTEGSKFISYKNIFTSELEKATKSAQWKADCKEQQNPISISLSPNISEENATEGFRGTYYLQANNKSQVNLDLHIHYDQFKCGNTERKAEISQGKLSNVKATTHISQFNTPGQIISSLHNLKNLNAIIKSPQRCQQKSNSSGRNIVKITSMCPKKHLKVYPHPLQPKDITIKHTRTTVNVTTQTPLVMPLFICQLKPHLCNTTKCNTTKILTVATSIFAEKTHFWKTHTLNENNPVSLKPTTQISTTKSLNKSTVSRTSEPSSTTENLNKSTVSRTTKHFWQRARRYISNLRRKIKQPNNMEAFNNNFSQDNLNSLSTSTATNISSCSMHCINTKLDGVLHNYDWKQLYIRAHDSGVYYPINLGAGLVQFYFNLKWYITNGVHIWSFEGNLAQARVNKLTQEMVQVFPDYSNLNKKFIQELVNEMLKNDSDDLSVRLIVPFEVLAQHTLFFTTHRNCCYSPFESLIMYKGWELSPQDVVAVLRIASYNNFTSAELEFHWHRKREMNWIWLIKQILHAEKKRFPTYNEYKFKYGEFKNTPNMIVYLNASSVWANFYISANQLLTKLMNVNEETDFSVVEEKGELKTDKKTFKWLYKTALLIRYMKNKIYTSYRWKNVNTFSWYDMLAYLRYSDAFPNEIKDNYFWKEIITKVSRSNKSEFINRIEYTVDNDSEDLVVIIHMNESSLAQGIFLRNITQYVSSYL